MRKLILGVGLTAAIAFPAAARAEESFYCYVSTQMRGEPEKIIIYTEIMTTSGDADGDKLDRAWGDFVSDTRGVLPPNTGSYGPNCTSYGRADMERDLAKLRADHPQARKMAWPNPPVPLRDPAKSSVTASDRTPRADIVIQDRMPTSAASAPEAPVRPKKSNAQADAEYAAALAVYERQMAKHRQQVDDYKRAQDDLARTKEEQRLAAEKALAAHRSQMEKAEAAQLEYRKELAKPAGVPNAIYRGFTGRSCDDARRSAVRGAGTTAGTQFREVRTEMSESGTCLVQGWWWNTGKGGASRQ